MDLLVFCMKMNEICRGTKIFEEIEGMIAIFILHKHIIHLKLTGGVECYH